ncbi:PK beta-barrel-protein domain-containing protein-like protein [Acephala macrosclerotiorum]|nr:PK beta-barrel-protein domain-containing protein-like protein [Acephala macrosclerotiorum]
MYQLVYAIFTVLVLYASIYHLIPLIKRIFFSHKSGIVISISKSPTHTFSKPAFEEITLIAGLGVEGDSHFGVEVQHLSRRKAIPIPPNLRQVHLIQSELFDEFKTTGPNGKSYDINPGDLGENITTRGLDILNLSVGTRLQFVNVGENENARCAVVRVTGLRNPCLQISKFREGLLERCVVKDENGKVVERKAGIMSVVEAGGVVKQGARIVVNEPWLFRKQDRV